MHSFGTTDTQSPFYTNILRLVVISDKLQPQSAFSRRVLIVLEYACAGENEKLGR